MTKMQIVNEICENDFVKKNKLTKKEVTGIIQIFIDEIKTNIDNDRKIDIKGFGSFYKAVKKARRIKSPIAGCTIDVPEKTILAFKGSKETEKVKGA